MKNTSANNGDSYRNSYNLDLRWNGIGLGSFGSIDVAMLYGIPLVSKYQKKNDGFSKDSGVLLTIDHALSVDSLMNHFIVQWGNNGFADVGAFGSNGTSIYTSGRDINGVRLVDWGTYDISDFTIGYGLFWGYIGYGSNASGSWSRPNSGWEYSITVRPSYKWTEYTRTTMEMGYSQRKNGTNGDGTWTLWAKDLNDDPDIYKITLAQEVTPGKGFWQRPAIRFYASYQGGDQFENKVGAQKLGRHNFQWSFGSQIEAWW
jgi:maltoporin